eukprot:9261279-Heterocapsa_arctica.AAC.1
MGEHAHLRLGTRLVPLLRRGNLFFLPVALPGQPWTVQQTAQLSTELSAIEGVNVSAIDCDNDRWALLEYCCSPTSLLAG